MQQALQFAYAGSDVWHLTRQCFADLSQDIRAFVLQPHAFTTSVHIMVMDGLRSDIDPSP